MQSNRTREGNVVSGPWPGSTANRDATPPNGRPARSHETFAEVRARELRRAAAELRAGARRLGEAGDREGQLALAQSATLLAVTAHKALRAQVGA
jgi:hypothetical protein